MNSDYAPTAQTVTGTLYMLTAAGLSEKGRMPVNEDAILEQTLATPNGRCAGLYAVCDGAGGHEAGHVASRMALKTIKETLDPVFDALALGLEVTTGGLDQRLQAAFEQANHDVWQASGREANAAAAAFGMATTAVAALVVNDQLHVAGVGDSRAYLWRTGRLQQITQDHSLPGELARMGQIDEAEVANHPKHNVLLQALGRSSEVEIDLYRIRLNFGDRILLCSDGLWKSLSNPQELGRYVASISQPAELCRALVAEAARRDDSDNISVVAAAIDEIVVEPDRSRQAAELEAAT